MIVRDATIDDLPEYLMLAQAFHAASPMNGVVAFDTDGYSQFYLSAIVNPSMGIWITEIDKRPVGIAGALLYPLYFNPSTLVAQELWWWLTLEARGTGAGSKMFSHIEKWSIENKANAIFMIALEDAKVEKMAKLYKRSGYIPMERTFMKEV